MKLLKIKHIQKDFTLQEGKHYCLTIENPNFFYTTLLAFCEMDTEKLFLSLNYHDLDLKKRVFFIDNLFSLNVNNKKLISLLHTELDFKNRTPHILDVLNQISELYSKVMEEIRYEVPFPIDYEENLTLKDLFSNVDLTIHDDTSTLIQKLVLYIKLQKQLMDFYLLVIPHLDSYLSPEELSIFIEEINALDVTLMIINSHSLKNPLFVSLIIDDDLCEIKDI